MRFFIDPVSLGIYCYEADARDFIDTAIKAGYVECGRAPAECETWNFTTGKWVMDQAKQAAIFKAKADKHLQAVRMLREQLLNRLGGLGYDALNEGDNDMVMATHAARRALRDITEAPAVVSATDIDQLQAAISTAYQAIVAAAPEPLQVAFVGIQL
jgi:hypothetical protein